MRLMILLFYFSLSWLYLPAQDINVQIRLADHLESIPDEMAAFTKFKEVLSTNPVNIYALTKCSELCIRIGKRKDNEKLRESYYEAARIYASTALKIDSLNSDANCDMAMALGRSTMNMSSREKIKNVREIKKYVDISLLSNPNNFKAWHVLGRWHYEVSSLNFFERATLKLFFGGLPESSMNISIVCFERARSIQPGFILNYIELAKAYRKNDETPIAIEALKVMLTLPNQTEDDPEIKEAGKKLLKVWQ